MSLLKGGIHPWRVHTTSPPKLRKEKNYESLLKRGKGKKRKEKSIVYSRVFKYRHFFEVWDLRVFKSVRVSVDIPKGTDQWPSNMEHSFDLLLFFFRWWCFFFLQQIWTSICGWRWSIYCWNIYIYIYIVDGRNHAPPGMYTTLEMGTTVGGWRLTTLLHAPTVKSIGKKNLVKRFSRTAADTCRCGRTNSQFNSATSEAISAASQKDSENALWQGSGSAGPAKGTGGSRDVRLGRRGSPTRAGTHSWPSGA